MSSKQNILRLQDSGDFIQWKKNIPIHYQAFVGRILEWSSLTCQFLQSIDTTDDQVLKSQQILFGTNNPKKEDNFLQIATISYYNQQYNKDDAKQKLNDIFHDEFKSIQVQKSISHKGPVLKAKAKQQNKNLIATRSSNNNIYIYNLELQNQENPIVLKEHQMQGYTLDWRKESLEIITSSFDGQVCIWDINKQPKQILNENDDNLKEYVEPIAKYDYNFKPITDVKFHKFQQNFFGYTTDHHIVFQDSREGRVRPFWSVLAHIDESTTLDFSPHDQFLLLSGAKTGRVKLWDMHLEHCQEEVLKVEWSPNLNTVFASSSSNNQIKLWDLSKINIQSKNQKIDFLHHSGHKGVITDFDWNQEQELSLLSTDSKNQLHYWQVKNSEFCEDENDEQQQLILKYKTLYNKTIFIIWYIFIMELNPQKQSLILFVENLKINDIIPINIYDKDVITDRFQYGIKKRHTLYSDWWFDFYSGKVKYPIHFQLYQKFWNWELQCMQLGGYLMDDDQHNRQLSLTNVTLESSWKKIGNFVYLNLVNLSQCYVQLNKTINFKDNTYFLYRNNDGKLFWNDTPNGTLFNLKISQNYAKNKQQKYIYYYQLFFLFFFHSNCLSVNIAGAINVHKYSNNNIILHINLFQYAILFYFLRFIHQSQSILRSYQSKNIINIYIDKNDIIK